MKVKIKGIDNLQDVIAWSSQTISSTDKPGMFGTIKDMIVPVVIIVVRGTTKVAVHPVHDIEELHK
jgi:hypothetical protein